MMTVISAGFWFGMTICQQIRNIPAPSTFAASIMASGIWLIDWAHEEEVHRRGDRRKDQRHIGIDHAQLREYHILHDVDDVTLIQEGNDDDCIKCLCARKADLCQTERRHGRKNNLTHGDNHCHNTLLKT